ncbi:porin [Orrella sp. JC864]|uniref:porin n=1 Tax=Orrella sp. JC864 TaxID=3120298 RepID=UPI00300B3DC7
MSKFFNYPLLAGTILAAAGAPAAAQSSTRVELYGVIDVGFLHDSDEVNGSSTGVNSGGEAGSRWGLRGAEDLGGGWKATFQVEGGIDMTNGRSQQGDRLFGRWAYLGLAGPYGEIRAGRQWVLGREWGGAATPFGIAWMRSGLGTTFGYNDGDFGSSGIADNMVMYRSPRVGGWEAALGYSFQPNGEQEAGPANNDRVLTGGLRYARGPVRVALTYEHAYASQNRRVGGRPATDATNWQLGGSYDFEVVRVYGGVGRISDASRGPARLMEKDVAWTAGVRVPAGPGSILASWQQTTRSDIQGGALGYQYVLSRRTDIYAFVNHTETRNRNSGEDEGRTQFSVGMRHRF